MMVKTGEKVSSSDKAGRNFSATLEGTLYPIQTGSFSEKSTGVILKRSSVVVPAGSILQFSLAQPVTVKK